MAFNAALSGLQAASNALEVHGNNIANASTTGFKQSTAEFRDVYAVGSLGSSANAIGTGVALAAVTQQFTQGNILAADTNLDLAINGSGFFVVDVNGARLYTRSGAFMVDKSGNISNSQRQHLIGFLTDSNGNITGAQGPLSIQNDSINPNKTAKVTAALNLDASATPPASSFVPGFTAANPPSSSTYNNSTAVQIYDSLGNQHIMTMYYVKQPVERTWSIYIGIDGTDATPTATAMPLGGTASAPVAYGAGQLSKPFTLVFNNTGQFVINNPASPAESFGSPPVLSTVSTTAPTTSGVLPKLAIGDLTINGVPISMGNVSDTSSTTDNASSAISLRDAINSHTNLHKVTASIAPNGTILDFTGGTYTVDALTAGNFTINGVQITGVPAAATPLALANLINGIGGTGVPGVVASVNVGQLRLSAVDGRNIEVATNGTATTMNFTNFATTGLAALDEVVRGQISLTTINNDGITIGGNNPAHAGLVSGTRAGIFQNNSDPIKISFNPGTGAATPQSVTVDLSTSSQFSAPFAITSLTQDGYPTGRLTGVQVDTSGIITAQFGNGQSQQLGQVALANFSNPTGLQPQGNSSWVETYSSGVALLGAPGTSDLGLIQSGSLEDSNVQLTDELVALILAQRNFQASAQTIRSADAITQTIINIR